MKKEDIGIFIKRLVNEECKIAELEDDIPLISFGIDSLSYILILGKIEKGLNITFPDEYLDMDCLNTIDKLTNYVYEHMN